MPYLLTDPADFETATRARSTDSATAAECDWSFATTEFYAALYNLTRRVLRHSGRRRNADDLVQDVILGLGLRPQDTVGADFGLLLHRAELDLCNLLRIKPKYLVDGLEFCEQRVAEGLEPAGRRQTSQSIDL